MNNAPNAVPTPRRQPNPFYLDVLVNELATGAIGIKDRVIVACGGDLDRVTLLAAGFTDVTITNLAPHGGHEDYTPFPWDRQDIENLTYPDASFDIAIVHSGLHHCYNPQRALGELCRVAKKSVIVFEPYETWFTRLGTRLGYGQMYEDSAVFLCGGAGGGVANTEIPNFVYRFNENEVLKFVRSFFPQGYVPVRFHRALRINSGRFATHRNALIRHSFKVAYPLIRMLAKVFPGMNNNLAFVITRPTPGNYHPWIRDAGGQPRVDLDFLRKKYARRGGP